MPTKKNRVSNGGHQPFTLRDAGVGGGQSKKGVQAPQHLFDNIKSGKNAAGVGHISHGADDPKTRVSFGGGKRERPKQTQRLSS